MTQHTAVTDGSKEEADMPRLISHDASVTGHLIGSWQVSTASLLTMM